MRTKVEARSAEGEGRAARTILTPVHLQSNPARFTEQQFQSA